MIPDYVWKALFVVTGLLLIKRAYGLLREVKSLPARGALHAVAGLAALFTANAVGGLFHLGVGLNGLTLPVSAVLGVPGVGLLWAVRYLL